MKRLSAFAITFALVVQVGNASGESYENQGWLNQGWLNQGWINQGWLNQGWLNQGWLNGGSASGYALQQMRTWQGQTIDGVTISGNRLQGSAWVWELFYGWHGVGRERRLGREWDWRYRALGPTEFTDAQFDMTVTDPDTMEVVGTVTAKIASVSGYGSLTDSFVYVVMVWISDDGTTWDWKPACGCEPGTGPGTTVTCAPVQSVPLRGGWNLTQGTFYGGAHIDDDPGHVTFACMNGALGKCGAEKALTNGMGYVPWRWRYEYDAWQNPVVWASGERDHNTCTRMVIADYCGDGQPHTYAGRPIEEWDHLPDPVNVELNSGGRPEAEWTPDGASWLSNCRVSSFSITECPTHSRIVSCNWSGCTWESTQHQVQIECLWDPNAMPNHPNNNNLFTRNFDENLEQEEPRQQINW